MKKTKSLLLLLIPALLAFPAMAQEKAAAPTGVEIIEQHLRATGTKEKLAQIKSRIAIGTVRREAEPATNMAIMSQPNQFSAVFLFAEYEWRLGYDGSKSFIRPRLSRTYEPIETKLHEMLESRLIFNSIGLYNLLLQPATNVKFEAKGTKKIKGREAYIVEVRQSKMSAMRMYFDTENYLWLRTDYGKAHVQQQMKGFTNEPVGRGQDDLIVDLYIETSDFREVDGLKLPHRFDMLVTIPILRQRTSGVITGTITEYRHNQPIDPQMFR